MVLIFSGALTLLWVFDGKPFSVKFTVRILWSGIDESKGMLLSVTILAWINNSKVTCSALNDSTGEMI